MNAHTWCVDTLQSLHWLCQESGNSGLLYKRSQTEKRGSRGLRSEGGQAVSLATDITNGHNLEK